MRQTTDPESLGCFVVVGTIALSWAVGEQWGETFGWMALGGTLLVWSVFSVLTSK